MDLIFVTNARFTKVEGVGIFGINTSLNLNAFNQYLNVFDRIFVVARVETVMHAKYSEEIRVDGPKVTVLEIPLYVGPFHYLLKSLRIRKLLKSYLSKRNAAVILRVPGTLGGVASEILTQLRKPYGVEVVADPLDIFADGSFSHPLRSFFRRRGFYQLRRVVQLASAALYVTQEKLQSRYPVMHNVISVSASDVWLPAEAFTDVARVMGKRPIYTIVSVGSLAQMYKSPDVVVQAISMLKARNYDVRLVWVGDGKYRRPMERLANKLQVSDRVKFVGQVKPGTGVIHFLDMADFFVLASRTEGLPRALVEAMARGLPSIASDVGGIPELISPEALIPINDSKALADLIQRLIEHPMKADELASRNLKEARKYEARYLLEKRSRFYSSVRQLTERFQLANNKHDNV